HRFRDAEEPTAEAQAQLEAAKVLARQGSLDEARLLLHASTQADPGLVDAWLQLAWLAQDPEERIVYLHQVLALEPDHAQAKAELARLEPAVEPPLVVEKAPRRRGRLWFLILLVVLALLALVALLLWGPVDSSLAGLLPSPTPIITPAPTPQPSEKAGRFAPQLQAALDGQDWDRAMELVVIMRNVDPSGEEVRQSALAAHMRYGQALVEQGEYDSALAQFDQAVSLDPAHEDAQLWQQVSQLHLEGRQALSAGDWPTAIQTLTQAHELLPEYGDLIARVTEAYRRQGLMAIRAEDWESAIQSLTQAREWAPDNTDFAAMLATAYRQRGISWQELNKLQKARTDLETALALQPNDEKAKTHYDEVMYILFPPKRIEIDISSQRFYAYKGDTLVYNFPTSTGLRGRDTAVGHFKVQSKIPMAYSSIWRLNMPYWLGIYNVGRIENGIHALPIRPDGSVMWAGLLGQRASYGCVILSNYAAKLIYDWAEIGTPVDIHY
ncbi:MAG: tetratricopeptide repeat protein, partial [Anaerolineae bacterium]|nr:tetratricopeptide repeat protein [Anaerolineae bacterium]